MKKLIILSLGLSLLAASCNHNVSVAPETPSMPVAPVSQANPTPVPVATPVKASVKVTNPTSIVPPDPTPTPAPIIPPAPVAVDFCINISGNQATVPDNMQRDTDGNCALISPTDAAAAMSKSLKDLTDDMAQITRLKANISYDDSQYSPWLTQEGLVQWRNYIGNLNSALDRLSTEINTYKINLFAIEQQVLQRNNLDSLIVAKLTVDGIIAQPNSYQSQISAYSLKYAQELSLAKSEDIRN